MIKIVAPFSDPVALVCNENGRIDGKPVHCVISDKMDIYGDFFLCGLGETELEDMPEEMIFKYASLFRLPRNQDHHCAEGTGRPWPQVLH